MSDDPAKEFTLGALTMAPPGVFNDPKQNATFSVNAIRNLLKQRGVELTAEIVRGLAGNQMAVVAEMHLIADEMEGLDPSKGPQLAKPGSPLPPCPICKEPCDLKEPGGFIMIHAHCAPPAGPPRVRVRRKKR